MADPRGQLPNVYGRQLDADELARDVHRDFVGGLWEEAGRWQFDLLLGLGLQPADRLLDLGCGCLRGGIHFVNWLDPGHYFGIDCNQSLLDAGLELELPRAGLADRLSREHLLRSDDYEASAFGVVFDWVLAQSLWSHLPWEEVRRSLQRIAPTVRPGGRLIATYFPAPSEQPLAREIVHSPAGIRTYADRDPFHFRELDLHRAGEGTGWLLLDVQPRQHPRGQWVSRWEREAG